MDAWRVVCLPNVGRCDHTYLHHLDAEYDGESGDADVTLFVPASVGDGYKWNLAMHVINCRAQDCLKNATVSRADG